MNTGNIRKSKQTERFTIIPNGILEDKTLSLKSIGLLCYLLRLPPEWAINKSRLHNNLKDGRDSVTGAFKELEDAGYITSTEVRERGRFIGYNYEVADNPQKRPISKDPKKDGGAPEIAENPQRDRVKGAKIAENPAPENPVTVEAPLAENPVTVPPPITGNPISVKPITDKPITENPALLNTNSESTILESTEIKKDLESNAPGKPDAPPVIPPADPKPKRSHKKKVVTPGPLLDAFADQHAQVTAAKSLHHCFIDVYANWFKETEGTPPKIDGGAGSAAKSLIGYLTEIVKHRAEKDSKPLSPEDLPGAVLEAWKLILSNWGKLEPFYQNKTRLIDINSNIQNIIKTLRNAATKPANGNGQNTAGVNSHATGKFNDFTTPAERYERINERFSDPRWSEL